MFNMLGSDAVSDVAAPYGLSRTFDGSRVRESGLVARPPRLRRELYHAEGAPRQEDLTAGLIDEIHLVISPVLLGRGEHLLTGIDTVSLGYQCTEHASTDHATHVVLTK
jgi:hypothetical protein